MTAPELRGVARTVAPDPQVILQAETTLRAVGWQVYRTADLAAAQAYVAALVNPGDLVVTHTSRSVPPFVAALQGRGIRVEQFGPDRPARGRENLIAAQLGITGATAVVAETGTVILAEDDGYGRLVSNLPYTHVVVAPVFKVVPRLEDGLELARLFAKLVLGKPVARYVSGISGPSKTGDIEFQIVQGMHGPGRVHLILLEVEAGPDRVDGVSLDLLCS